MKRAHEGGGVVVAGVDDAVEGAPRVVEDAALEREGGCHDDRDRDGDLLDVRGALGVLPRLAEDVGVTSSTSFRKTWCPKTSKWERATK